MEVAGAMGMVVSSWGSDHIGRDTGHTQWSQAGKEPQ